jgi:hypothetical protein
MILDHRLVDFSEIWDIIEVSGIRLGHVPSSFPLGFAQSTPALAFDPNDGCFLGQVRQHSDKRLV